MAASIPTPGAVSAPAATPVSDRTAATILGSMVLLIVALTVTLIQTSRATPDLVPAPSGVELKPTDLAER